MLANVIDADVVQLYVIGGDHDPTSTCLKHRDVLHDHIENRAARTVIAYIDRPSASHGAISGCGRVERQSVDQHIADGWTWSAIDAYSVGPSRIRQGDTASGLCDQRYVGFRDRSGE